MFLGMQETACRNGRVSLAEKTVARFVETGGCAVVILPMERHLAVYPVLLLRDLFNTPDSSRMEEFFESGYLHPNSSYAHESQLTYAAHAAAIGLGVEARFPLRDTHVDLLVGAVDSQGAAHHYLIELKNGAKRVGVSSVWRTLSLQEVLKSWGFEARSVIASESGFSLDARGIARRTGIYHVPLTQLPEWLDAIKRRQPFPRMPLYRIRPIRGNSLRIPQDLRSFLPDGNVMVIGLGTHIELWSREDYEIYEANRPSQY